MRSLLPLVVLAGLAFAGYRLYQQTLIDGVGSSCLRDGLDTSPALPGLLRTGTGHAFAAFAAQTPPLYQAASTSK
jgi:hypothetical protein